MQKGLEILANGGILPSGEQSLSADTTTQIEDLMAQFWSSDMTAADAQAKYVDLIGSAD
jgi:glucose/mannose transport system substrate-binding protein